MNPYAVQKLRNKTLGQHIAELGRLIQPASNVGSGQEAVVPKRHPVQRDELVGQTAQTRRRKWFYFHWARSTILPRKITLCFNLQTVLCPQAVEGLYSSKVNKSEV